MQSSETTGEARESESFRSVDDLYGEFQERINRRIQLDAEGVEIPQPQDPFEHVFESLVDQVLNAFSLYASVRMVKDEVDAAVEGKNAS